LGNLVSLIRNRQCLRLPRPAYRAPQAARQKRHRVNLQGWQTDSRRSKGEVLTPTVINLRLGAARSRLSWPADGDEPNPLLIASLMNGDQTLLHLTLATAVVVALVIFATAFLFGIWCGWIWRQRRRRSRAAVELKHRARA
jgi:hypothetical protein